MVLNTANVTDTLKKCIVNINYRNHDGVKRKARCTLKPSALPPQTVLEEFTGESRILVAYDIPTDRWVAIDLEQITSFEPEV